MAVTIIRADGASLTFDGSPEQSYAVTGRVTEHPVEDGSTFGDHYVRLPDTETIPVVVTMSPKAFGTLPPGPLRLEVARQFLEEARGQLLTVVTSRRVLTDRMLLGVSWRDTTTEQRVFELRLKQLQIATAQSVEIPPEAPRSDGGDGGSADAEMPSAQDFGEQAKKEMEEATPPDTDAGEEAETEEERDASAAREAWEAWA